MVPTRRATAPVPYRRAHNWSTPWWSPLEERCLFSYLDCLSEACDFWPTDDESIIPQCFLGALAAFTDVVKPVGQFTGRLCLPAQSSHQCRCSGFALAQSADEVV